jgi:CBS domain-containing protein
MRFRRAPDAASALGDEARAISEEGGTMRVSDVMTEKVFTVDADVPLKLVATRMLEYGVS